MKALLCVDFGSTFTKLRGFDQEHGKLVASAQTPTTVATSIQEGLEKGLEELAKQSGLTADQWTTRLACSSAAGGLRMAAIGLVPDLTLKAARQAALGAGAKIIGSYSGALSANEIDELAKSAPDIILLCGGTDGGNRSVILENASLLAGARITAAVVVAGNKSAADEAAAILRKGEKQAVTAANVLPALDRLDVLGAQNAIRDIFLERILIAKGFKRVAGFFHEPLMPTPRAVLLATDFLGKRLSREGEHPVMVVDLGGATTDVHSAASGLPSAPDMISHGLPEPYLKRTVEGDIGMRYSALGILAAAGADPIALRCGLDREALRAHCLKLAMRPEDLPQSLATQEIDAALAGAAVETAMERHAGVMQNRYGPHGQYTIVEGKDLRPGGTIIGTGGYFVYGRDPLAALARAGYNPAKPWSLRPETPFLALDEEYLLFAIGLMAHYIRLNKQGEKSILDSLLKKRTRLP